MWLLFGLWHFFFHSFIFKMGPLEASSFSLLQVGAFLPSWLWLEITCILSLLLPTFSLARALLLWAFWWLPKWCDFYFHSSQLRFLQDSKLRMIIIFCLDHLGNFLELLFILLGFVSPDTWITKEIPKRDSSISVLLATYLVLRDLLLIDSCVFWVDKMGTFMENIT